MRVLCVEQWCYPAIIGGLFSPAKAVFFATSGRKNTCGEELRRTDNGKEADTVW